MNEIVIALTPIDNLFAVGQCGSYYNTACYPEVALTTGLRPLLALLSNLKLVIFQFPRIVVTWLGT